ncbi:molecular chaperone DnaJ [Streptomyces sp. NRRL F-4489]|uniref:DnaJ family domain-containing protein n=1 Tax=Streptomyces sp. NRRL F-4489 TaxID=1609095 RepID=UPI00074A1575|nr:DUF1992 domain-containing protein [Streptomyces sp. NRRL F-4489]KUL34338.1 molecular chaperone DnaJ [Streptomyces sp. NRRL F-4489]
MTERKPPGVSFESWVDKQIRESAERGGFEDLPGFGKPLPHLDRPYDEMWWIKEKMHREDLSLLPPSLVLRKEAEDALRAAADAPSEAALRRVLAEINERIRAALAAPPEGPPLNLVPYDIEEQARLWRERHGG